MTKIIVNPGRRVWDRERHREATEGEVLDVKDVEAKILKYRGLASDAPQDKPPAKPVPPPAPPARPAPPATPATPAKPPPPAAAEEVPTAVEEAPPAEEAQATLGMGEEEPVRTRRPYRRRDLQPEE